MEACGRALVLSVTLLTLISDAATAFTPTKVAGIVVNENGRPLDGVRCRISGLEEMQDGHWRLSGRLGTAVETTTDNEGRFVLNFQELLRYDVQFYKRGYAPAFSFQVPSESPELKVIMRRGQPLRGTVSRTVDGRPAPLGWAQVRLQLPSDAGWAQDETFTDTQGLFEFRVCPPPEPPLRTVVDVDGKASQRRHPRPTWQVVFACETVAVAVREGEPVEEVSFEITVKSVVGSLPEMGTSIESSCYGVKLP